MFTCGCREREFFFLMPKTGLWDETCTCVCFLWVWRTPFLCSFITMSCFWCIVVGFLSFVFVFDYWLCYCVVWLYMCVWESAWFFTHVHMCKKMDLCVWMYLWVCVLKYVIIHVRMYCKYLYKSYICIFGVYTYYVHILWIYCTLICVYMCSKY